MEVLDYKKLYGRYARDEGYTVNKYMAYMRQVANKFGIPQEVMDATVELIFRELAEGKRYPLTHCPCGCGIDKSGTAIAHASLAKLLELNEIYQADKRDFEQRVSLNAEVRRVLGDIEQQLISSDILVGETMSRTIAHMRLTKSKARKVAVMIEEMRTEMQEMMEDLRTQVLKEFRIREIERKYPKWKRTSMSLFQRKKLTKIADEYDELTGKGDDWRL